jgi:uncharacterized repeat protein (TIGR03803 family)
LRGGGKRAALIGSAAHQLPQVPAQNWLCHDFSLWIERAGNNLFLVFASIESIRYLWDDYAMNSTVFSRNRRSEETSIARSPVRRVAAVGGMACFLWLGIIAARAGVTLSPIHSFSAPDPNGATPYGPLVQGTDGNFYGTAAAGGAYGWGAVFRITPDGMLTNIYSFTGSNDGAFPRGALLQIINGNFYGTASLGGTSNGTVFEISSTGVFTLLHTFMGSPFDGATPFAGLVQGTDGNFYGTTMTGGARGLGTIFRMTPGGTFTNFYSFTGKTDGTAPFAPLVQGTDGQLYGTTTVGGDTALAPDNAGDGAIFKITTNGVLTPLYAFTGEDDGEEPYSALVQGIDGNFYGTSMHTTNGNGAVFRITPQGNFALLHDFAGTDGAAPIGALIQAADTNLYGATLGGGSNNEGTVFQITTNGVLTSLYSFTNGTDGARPFASLVQATNGKLYGTTMGSEYQMPRSVGSIFQITTEGALTTLYTFPGGSDGATPYAAMVLGTNGNLYGTTLDGGTNGDGTAFEMTLDGNFMLLHSFTGLADGAMPYGALVQGSDGNFYGTDGDNYGQLPLRTGVAAYGTVFKMTPAGSVTVLHAFTNGIDGALPRAGLVEGLDGNFYGTSEMGGANGQGTIFRITPEGVLTNLHTFTGGSDGGNPWAALVQASDTNFYGTASSGGAGYGTVFMISPDGTFTVISEFDSDKSSDTSGPHAPLALGTDGSLYGCTAGLYSGGFGTIFKVTPPNAFSLLYTFTNGIDGANPTGGLVQGSDGNFYGTIEYGGQNGTGGIFRVTTGGVLRPLYAFSAVDGNGFNEDGANPSAGLVQAGDGNFYGTTEIGGPYGSGTIFRMTVTPTAPPAFLSATNIDGALLLTWSTEFGALYQLQYATNLSQPIWANIGGPISATHSTLGAETDTDPADAQRFYRVVLLP